MFLTSEGGGCYDGRGRGRTWSCDKPGRNPPPGSGRCDPRASAIGRATARRAAASGCRTFAARRRQPCRWRSSVAKSPAVPRSRPQSPRPPVMCTKFGPFHGQHSWEICRLIGYETPFSSGPFSPTMIGAWRLVLSAEGHRNDFKLFNSCKVVRIACVDRKCIRQRGGGNEGIIRSCCRLSA